MADTTNNIILTEKETVILKMIAEGKTSPDIAKALCLSLPTIKWYRKRLKDKFGCSSTVMLIRKAMEWHLL